MTRIVVPGRLYPTVPCRSCHAPMFWAEGENGRRNPLDPDPVPNGNIQLDDAGFAVYVKPMFADPNKPKYVSHFSTCPQAHHHRRR